MTGADSEAIDLPALISVHLLNYSLSLMTSEDRCSSHLDEAIVCLRCDEHLTPLSLRVVEEPLERPPDPIIICGEADRIDGKTFDELASKLCVGNV